MSQLNEARDAVREIYALSEALAAHHALLRDVLDRAQNGPPDGDADGTISADQFTSLRALERQITYMFASLAGAHRV